MISASIYNMITSSNLYNLININGQVISLFIIMISIINITIITSIVINILICYKNSNLNNITSINK